MTDRCDGRYPVPHRRDEPFEVTYRCGLHAGHDGPHGPDGPARESAQQGEGAMPTPAKEHTRG